MLNTISIALFVLTVGYAFVGAAVLIFETIVEAKRYYKTK